MEIGKKINSRFRIVKLNFLGIHVDSITERKILALSITRASFLPTPLIFEFPLLRISTMAISNVTSLS